MDDAIGFARMARATGGGQRMSTMLCNFAIKKNWANKGIFLWGFAGDAKERST